MIRTSSQLRAGSRMRHGGCGEPLALADLRGGDRGRCRVDGMREPESLGDPGCDPDRPVGTGRGETGDLSRAGESLDRDLVLGGDDRALVGEREAGRARITVDRDHVQVTARACGLEQPELRRSGA